MAKRKDNAVEVVESKGIRIPIYSAPVNGYGSFLLAYYQEGVRKRERAKTLELARARARELIDKLADGSAHVIALTPKQQANLSESLDILQSLGGQISFLEAIRRYADAYKALGEDLVVEAAEHYARYREAEKIRGIQPIKFPQLVEKLLTDIKQDKSRRYVYDMQARLGALAKMFSKDIADISAEEIDLALSSLKVAGRTRNNYRTCLITAFSFARDKGYLPREAKTEAEFSKRVKESAAEIGIYTPNEFKKLLEQISPRLIPFLALGGFAGLRSAEITRAKWSDIHWSGGKGSIQVGADQAKTASRRLIPIQPALASWLKPFAKEEGYILPGLQDEFHLARTCRNAVKAIKWTAGVKKVEPVSNGCRHSFCSYRLAVVKSTAEVSLEAGNSPKMLFEHYREVAVIKDGKKFLVDEEAGKEWFSLAPSKARRTQIKDWLAQQVKRTALPAAS